MLNIQQKGSCTLAAPEACTSPQSHDPGRDIVFLLHDSERVSLPVQTMQADTGLLSSRKIGGGSGNFSPSNFASMVSRFTHIHPCKSVCTKGTHHVTLHGHYIA